MTKSVPSGSFGARERWVLLVASAWLVSGLQLDAYAHATTPELETFWTPWHGVLYSGIAVSGLTLVWLMRPRLPVIPTYSTVLALPNALRIPLAGMALLLVGGGVDTLWHNVFGIEQGLEIFVSPSHEFIILGMALVAAGPALMLAGKPGRGLSVADGTLATLSALLSVLPLHIYSLHASALGIMYFGEPGDTVRIFSIDAQVMHGYLFSTVLLFLPILIMGRRWRLPIGVPTVLVAVPAVLMHLMFLSEEGWWLALTVAGAAAGAELVLRLAGRVVRWSVDAHWFAAGLVAPLIVWGTVLVAATQTVGVGWNVHMVSGLLTLVAITGGLTALVARRVQPAPAQAAYLTGAPAPASTESAAGTQGATATGSPAGTQDAAAADDESRTGVPAS
ncbi:hypothetical protein [Actinoplanes auranticolor]|uniref:Uncharacterized protein n=1 Tax=Actinoplanes auranticolor TaxID=47988 RepID=A0A919SVC3_9ACTN|nr:hypothetical protein [Actinoplanes auranticolor]GIM79560.1 hypothetical protein Aau02nite_86390 [Actinoplanes auranticolor]